MPSTTTLVYIGLMLLGAIFGAGVTWGGLKQRLNTLEKNQTEQKTATEGNTAAIGTLKSDMAAIKSDMASVKGNVETLVKALVKHGQKAA